MLLLLLLLLPLPQVVSGRRHIGILGVEPVGSYAVSIKFDDLHRTGIYTWPLLWDLGAHKFSRMKAYIQALRQSGLSRDPRRSVPPGTGRLPRTHGCSGGSTT